MSSGSVNAAIFVLSFALVLVLFSQPANGQRSKRFSGQEPMGGSDLSNINMDDAVRDYIYSMIMSRMNSEPEPRMTKRGPHGYLDFGVSRGASGAEAAKARLGLKLAHNPFGPGR